MVLNERDRMIEYKVSQFHSIVFFWVKQLLIMENVLGIVGYLAMSLNSIYPFKTQ